VRKAAARKPNSIAQASTDVSPATGSC